MDQDVSLCLQRVGRVISESCALYTAVQCSRYQQFRLVSIGTGEAAAENRHSNRTNARCRGTGDQNHDRSSLSSTGMICSVSSFPNKCVVWETKLCRSTESIGFTHLIGGKKQKTDSMPNGCSDLCNVPSRAGSPDVGKYLKSCFSVPKAEAMARKVR